MSESAATLKKLRKASAFTGILVSLAVADYLFCEHAVDPFDTTTTTTTTVRVVF